MQVLLSHLPSTRFQENNMNNTRILYVEDEKSIRDELAEILALDFDNILIAENGEEGLALYKTHRPDLVISDIQMPKMDGLQMCKEILSINKDTKIILTTAFNEGRFTQEADALKINAYITKPIDIKELYTAIGATLNGIQEDRDEK